MRALRCIAYTVTIALSLGLAAPVLAAASLDGSNTNNSFSGSGTYTISATTTQTNDVIVLFITDVVTSGGVATVSSISDGSGLTWHKRASKTQAGSGSEAAWTSDFEVWWAAAGSTVTGDTISITMSGNSNNWAVSEIGVHGLNNINAPWDTNSGLPGIVSTNTAGLSTTISTNYSADFLIAAAGGGIWVVNPTSPAGFTAGPDATNGGGAAYAQAFVPYEVVSSAQSALSVSSGTTGSGYPTFLVGDALAAGIALAVPRQITIEPYRKLWATEIMPRTVPPNAVNSSINFTNTSTHQAIAGVAGARLCVTGGVVANSSASADALLTFTDGNGGSTLFHTAAPGLLGMSGAPFKFATPICGSVGNPVYVQSSAAVSTLYVTLTGFSGN